MRCRRGCADNNNKGIVLQNRQKIAWLFILLASSPSYALTGKVVAIADGDTLTVLADNQQTKVRLVEIDAPEKAQPFGNRSKQSLSDMCFGKVAEIREKGKDRYKRTLGRVYCDGVDTNAEQVRRGMAWIVG